MQSNGIFYVGEAERRADASESTTTTRSISSALRARPFASLSTAAKAARWRVKRGGSPHRFRLQVSELIF